MGDSLRLGTQDRVERDCRRYTSVEPVVRSVRGTFNLQFATHEFNPLKHADDSQVAQPRKFLHR